MPIGGGAKVRPPNASLDGGGGELDLDVATNAPLRFEGIAQSVVYARIFFIDNPSAPQPGAGTWLGGYDLNQGLGKKLPLTPITLTKGQGTAVTIDLKALRKFTVAVSRNASLTPLGDGQGSLAAVASSNHTLNGNGKGVVMGLAQSDCKDLSGSTPVEVKGLVVGPGPYWLASVLNDFGAAGDVPAGALISIDIPGGVTTIPDANMITYPANAYQVQASIDLIAAMPVGDAGPDNLSCTTTGGNDAGTDAPAGD